MSSHTLAANNLVCGFKDVPGGKHKVRRVARLDSLSVQSGEIVVLAGPNGAGKSTTVKTLARQLPPLSGAVTIDGNPVSELSARELARQLAYVGQTLDPLCELTVSDFVMLGRNPHQNWWSWDTSPADREEVAQALAATGMSDLRARSLAELSGGERQRAAIACACAQKASFLLLDEPAAHLDLKHQVSLLDLLRRLRDQGLGIVLVLHDLSMIARIADRVVLLRKPADSESIVHAQGAYSHVLTPATLKEVFEVDIAVTKDPTSGLPAYLPL